MRTDPDVLREMYKADMIKGECCKWLLFFLYHIILFGTVYLIFSNYIGPSFDDWTIPVFWDLANNLLNWFRKFAVVISKTVFTITFIYSVISCFSEIKEGEIAQWSLNGWMPDWGKNQKSWIWGIFLGLPKWMVKIISKPLISEVKIYTEEVQADFENEPTAVEFKFSYQIKVLNTRLDILRPNRDVDLTEFIIAKLNEWLRVNTYENIKNISDDKANILNWLNDVLRESILLYGDEIENFKFIHIQDPESKIKQQLENDIKRRNQLATDERELLNLKAVTKQIKRLIKTSKDMGDTPPLTLIQAEDIIRKQLGLTRVSETTIRGGGSRTVNVLPPN